MLILKIIIGLVAVALILVGGGWLGTRVALSGFAPLEKQTVELGTVPLPAGLPAPVARYAQAVFGGGEMPLIKSAIVTGRVDLNFNGLKFPGRFKIYHDAGNAYYHFMQMGWFGQPIVTVNERYINGVATLNQPGSLVDDDPKTNAAANLGLWAESIWLPSIWFTNERIRWEAVDDTTARLIVPNAAAEEVFQVSFDPPTGLLTGMTTMRYQNPDSPARVLWTTRSLEWGEFNGIMIPTLADIRWGSDAPWATWYIESVTYNVDVSQRLAQFGGDFKD